MEKDVILVLPILGPSTARDTIGSLQVISGGDAWYNITVRNDTHYVSDFDYYFSVGANGVDFLAKNIEHLKILKKIQLIFMHLLKVYICKIEEKKLQIQMK